MIDRRRLICTLAVCLLASPITTFAQQPTKVARIGFLGSSAPPPELLATVRGGLRERGYVEGSNLALEVRWTEGSFDALPALANELARSRVDLIFAWATPATLVAKRATSSIPIVFFAVSDPVGSGLVASLARPGGNVTGVTNIAKDLTARQVQMLVQIAPGIRRVAIMGNPTNLSAHAQQAEADAAARALGVTPLVVSVREPDRIVPALADAVGQGADGLVVLPDPTFLTRRREIADTGARAQVAEHLRAPRSRAGGRTRGVRREPFRPDRACDSLRGPNLERRAAGGVAGRAADQARTSHQPEDRKGARPDNPAIAARAGG